ncbi:hypothetical protein CK214_28210 [Mesorhizobium sp. WSM3882]|nr:hypothetical protein CK214_28210 [Mesorhizobium sp. WSM3882]
MARPTVQHADAEPQQPDAEAGVGLAAGIARRRAAVHQHRQRQAIAAKGNLQLPAYRPALLVGAADSTRLKRE